MTDVIGQAVALAATRVLASAAEDMIAAGVRRETVACALLAVAVEKWGEARGEDTVPMWLMDAAGLRSVIDPAAAETGGLH